MVGDKLNGIIIRNGLALSGSWTKRVKHWNQSFNKNGVDTKIICANPSKPIGFINGKDGIHYLNSLWLPSIIGYFLSPIVILFKLIKEKPDFVLLANGGFLEFYTIPLYCKIKGIPLLVDMVDTIGRKYKKNKTIIDYIIIYNKVLFDKIILRSAFEVFCISSELLNKYKALYPNKRVSMSIPSTVDIDEFEINSKLGLSVLKDDSYDIFNEKDFVKIFYAGTITRLNGIDFLLKALSNIIKTENYTVKIIFAIIDGNVDSLNKLLSSYNLREYSVIVPAVEQRYLPILLTKADILFIPEQGDETANAGFPGKTSEYLLSETPIITTMFSDLDVYLTNKVNSMITKRGDFSAYQDNLKQLISNKEFRKKLGKEGALLAKENFSSKDSFKPYMESVDLYYSS